MTTVDPSATEPTKGLLRGIRSALSRPVLLDPDSVDPVMTGAPFHAMRGDGSAERKKEPYALDGEVAVLSVEGPLSQRAWSCMGVFSGDGYDSIEERMLLAFADPKVSSLLVSVDSPGGEVAGLFSSVRAIRSAKQASGKSLVIFVNEQATSAAYAIATAADAIVLPDTGLVGSIGVITTIADFSAANEMDGVKYHVIASGSKKAYGHPDVPLSEDARDEIQSRIDQLAEVFFHEVANARPSLTVESVRNMEAGVFLGQSAVDAGLADKVGSRATAMQMARDLAAARKPAGPTASALPRGEKMQEVIKALGLPENATEADAVGVIAGMQKDLDRADVFWNQVNELTGKDNASESVGVIRAYKAASDQVESLQARLSEIAAKAEADERARLIELGTNVTESGKGNLTPAMVADIVPSWSTDQLRAYVEKAPRVYQAPVKEPETPTQQAYAGKPWDKMTPAEKAELANKDRATYDAFRAEAKRSKAAQAR